MTDAEAAKAGLEKVTDFVEDKGVDGARASEALSALATADDAAAQANLERERALAAVKIDKADVDLVVQELEVDRAVADRELRVQGGDVVNGNGTGSESIFGPTFADEWADNKSHVKHQKAGMLAMANAGPDTNGSQFYVTHKPTGWLDGKHVVFGHVVEGMERIQWIEANAGSGDGTPAIEVIIKDCGEVKSKST